MKNFIKNSILLGSVGLFFSIVLGPSYASNISYLPLQDNYITELSQTLGDEATDLTITVDEVPTYDPSTSDTYAVIEPGTSRAEVVLIDSYNSGDSTLTVAGGGRGQNLYLGDARATKRFEHPSGSSIIISDNYLFWQAIATAVNSKLDNTGGNATTTFDLDLSGSNFRIRKDGNDMKFTDDNQAEVSLSTLAAAAGVDDKLKISVTDTMNGYLQGKFNAGDGLDEAIGTPGGDETLDVSVDVTDIIDTSYGLTEDTNNIRVNLHATPGLEFSVGALRVKLKTDGGLTLDADGLSLTDAFNPTTTFTTYENVTADQALALLPVEVEYFSQLVEVDLNLGDNNARREYAVEFTPSQVPSFTTLSFRGREVGNSTALITLTIETDNAGAPSGTAVPNGTAANLDSSSWTTTYGTRTATFPGVPTMAAGTNYWLVWSTSNTDAANYVSLGVNSTYDENYLTFERKTYSIDTATWSGAVTNATPFFWTASTAKALGMAVVPTDADWGGRAWSFIGFAKDTISANDDVEVYLNTVPNITVVPNGIYYLSSTAGAISTTNPETEGTTTAATAATPPIAGYKIGRAISTTDLKIEPGQKRVVYRHGSIAATQTSQYITWFKPSTVRVAAGGGGGGDYGISTSFGFGSAYLFMENAGGQTAGTTSGQVYVTGGGAGFTGALGTFTDGGFPLTYTRAGDNMGAILEAIQ